MLFIQKEHFSELYVEVVQQVLSSGIPISPRGLPTVEVRPAHFVLENPRTRFLECTGRYINPAFAVAEAIWILSGSDAPWIFTFNSKLRQFTDNGVLQGAYGPRIRKWNGMYDQLDIVRRLLLEQPATRQATIQIFDPSRDYQGYRDVPCTLNHRFLIRDNRLDMYTTMRSQDIWLGLPYDVFTNTILHELMAGWVGAEVGYYHHRVDSLHMYKHDQKAAEQVSLSQTSLESDMSDLQIDWSTFDPMIKSLADGQSIEVNSWKIFETIMLSYRAWKSKDRETASRLVEGHTDRLSRSLQQWYIRHP